MLLSDTRSRLASPCRRHRPANSAIYLVSATPRLNICSFSFFADHWLTVEFTGRTCRRCSPEITTDLLFVFEGLVEFLNDLLQFVGIFCFQCRVAQLLPALML